MWPIYISLRLYEYRDGYFLYFTPFVPVRRCIFYIFYPLYLSMVMDVCELCFSCSKVVQGSFERSISLGRTGNSAQADEFLNKLKGYLESFPMTLVNRLQPSTTSPSSSGISPDWFIFSSLVTILCEMVK